MVLLFEFVDFLQYFFLERLSAELNVLAELLKRRSHVLLRVDNRGRTVVALHLSEGRAVHRDRLKRTGVVLNADSAANRGLLFGH